MLEYKERVRNFDLSVLESLLRSVSPTPQKAAKDVLDKFPSFQHAREILRGAILLRASSVMIAHNHPSGDPRPSPKDITLTEHLEGVLNLMDIVLFDHLIFGEGKPYSLRANCDI